MEFDKWLIKEYKHWKIYLHKNQCYLGRVYAWAKREDAIDFFDISKGEKKEFFEIGKSINKALNNLFHPDIMNYVSLGNETRHLHIHFIPRYKSERIFERIKFKDEKWGKNYAPYDKDFKINEKILIKIRDSIRRHL